jgi:hypothetical protein
VPAFCLIERAVAERGGQLCARMYHSHENRGELPENDAPSRPLVWITLNCSFCFALIIIAGMQQQRVGQKSRNPIILNALSSHPSSWDDLADAPPNVDVGDGSCVMSHLGMRLADGRWLAFELQGDPNGVPVL